ncbi:MAG TPA: NIL domain-containing protein, partial [Bacilli bacterium]|nr:NIL domain-containing protein [Bacilli bacterium]
MNVIKEICDRVGVIDGGEIVELGPVTEVFLKPQQAITKEFVAQVSDFEIPQEILAGFQATQSSTDEHRKLIQVSFLGDTTFQPVMFELLHEKSVPFSILHGTISRMKETPYGRLVLELTGNPQALDDVIAALKERGLDVEVIH